MILPGTGRGTGEAGGGGARPARRPEVAAARKLRKEMSLPEVLLWQRLRAGGIGAKFRRQHPVGPYIADFYCRDAKLILEVDGVAHDNIDRAMTDERRDLFLQENGYQVMRVMAADILRDLGSVIIAIAARVGSPLHHPSDGPQFRVDHAPGMILDCRGQSNPKLRAGEDQ